MRPPRALPAAHFERNDGIIICETVHLCGGLLPDHENFLVPLRRYPCKLRRIGR
jgi:hypothetical protein